MSGVCAITVGLHQACGGGGGSITVGLHQACVCGGDNCRSTPDMPGG